MKDTRKKFQMNNIEGLSVEVHKQEVQNVHNEHNCGVRSVNKAATDFSVAALLFSAYIKNIVENNKLNNVSPEHNNTKKETTSTNQNK